MKRLSKIHKKRISESMKGKSTFWLIGRKLSNETKLKISLSKKGKKHSTEWNKKVGDSQRGKFISDETRKKMSESALKNPRKYWLCKKRPEITGVNSKVWVNGNYKKSDNKMNDSAYVNWRKEIRKKR